MKAFRIKGEFLMGKSYQPFTKEVAAKDEDEAVEKLLSLLGSKHRTRRKNIKIQRVEEIQLEEVIDPVVSYLLRMG
ncbi:MAG: 50S ribosomal protein L18Ae [Thermoplasmata archaeon]